MSIDDEQSGGEAEPMAGVLIIDKPIGQSSMKTIAGVRRRAGAARVPGSRRTKVGHAGTLDPLATGVLVVAIGRAATRLIGPLMATSKGYQTEIDLSAFTPSDDAESPREPVHVSTPPTREAIDETLDQFRGDILQRPPVYSAMKVGGERAYKLAREGNAPDLAPRPVHTESVTIEDYVWPRLTLDIQCGKGFYVRSLARELGTALGTGGTCLSIRRTAVGPFTIDMATKPADLPESLARKDLLSIEETLALLGADSA